MAGREHRRPFFNVTSSRENFGGGELRFQMLVADVLAKRFVVAGFLQEVLQVSIDDLLVAIDRGHLNEFRIVSVVAYEVGLLLNRFNEPLIDVVCSAGQFQIGKE